MLHWKGTDALQKFNKGRSLFLPREQIKAKQNINNIGFTILDWHTNLH